MFKGITVNLPNHHESTLTFPSNLDSKVDGVSPSIFFSSSFSFELISSPQSVGGSSWYEIITPSIALAPLSELSLCSQSRFPQESHDSLLHENIPNYHKLLYSLGNACCVAYPALSNPTILDNHVQMYNIYSDNQWGFRKDRSTETFLLFTTERWRAALDDNKVIGVIFIDYKEAFDAVSHELLPHKLQAAGIIGNSYSWLLDYLNNRSQYTVVNSWKLATKNIRYGVAQGLLLGPRLYSIYLNDLPNAVPADSVVENYADDTTSYCIGDNVDVVILLLNSVLKHICKWLKRNRLSIHLGKSKAMLISTTSSTGPLQELN